LFGKIFENENSAELLFYSVESQTRFFENIIFEHYRIDERTRQFFVFAQSDLGDEGIK
jgi:hypothetical protein